MRNAVRKPITVSLDPELVEEIDQARGLVPRSRWVEKLIGEAQRKEGKERRA